MADLPAMVELSVPPLRKQAGLPPSRRDATASRSRLRNSSASASNEAPDASVNDATQYGATLKRPCSNTAQWPGGTRNTPLKIVRGDGMA